MNYPPIPSQFIHDCNIINWSDVLWGYKQQILDWKFIIEFADHKTRNSDCDELELDILLYDYTEIEKIEENLNLLANKEGEQNEEKSKNKWMLIALKWIFENKYLFKNPLDEVESIYADFDYPPEIKKFVAYMPDTEGYKPENHSPKENTERLFYNWKKYIEIHENLFKQTNN